MSKAIGGYVRRGERRYIPPAPDDGIPRCAEQTGQKCVLMAAVARELDAVHAGVALREGVDQRPGAVDAAVVHEVDGTVGRHEASRAQGVEHRREPLHGRRECRFLVVAGHDDGEVRRRTHARVPDT